MNAIVNIKSLPQYPQTRFFRLEGLPPVAEPLLFQPGDTPARSEIRNATIEQAKDARFPMGSVLLKMPYFSQIAVRNVKDAPCIDLTVINGRRWNEIISQRSLEQYITDRLQNDLQNAPALTGKAGLSEIYNLVAISDELDTFVNEHSLQGKVKDDKGIMYYNGFNTKTGHVTIVFGEACASSNCKVQDVSQNTIRDSLMLRFPYVRDVDFILDAPQANRPVLVSSPPVLKLIG